MKEFSAMFSYPCQRTAPTPFTRRGMLRQSAAGFGGVALAALLGKPARGAAGDDPFAWRPPHYRARAR